MAGKSNDQGRAYEYACLYALKDEIGKIRPVEVEINSSHEAAREAWTRIERFMQEILKQSAAAAAETIIELEPLIKEDGNDTLTLKLQKDSEGETGDVRDILVIRRNISWEIGLSVKHNHFAVKHSRIGKTLDFGDRWFGRPCSAEYWQSVKPVFDYLEREKRAEHDWKDMPDKENDVYVPLLRAFSDELKRSNAADPTIPRKMVEYLLGKFDFYKVISVDARRITQIQTFNLRGSLNKASQKEKSAISVPIASLPTRIVNLDFKPGSNNTVELYMDGGWQFSFRIHNAATKVETSLKFDVQIIGVPATIITINSRWK